MPIFKFSRQPNVLELQREEDVDGLIEALDYQDDHNIRLAAATALGKIGDRRAVDPLIAALDDQGRVKEVVVQALGEIGDPRAADPLITVLDDRDWEVKSTAAKALGKIGEDRAIQPLIMILREQNEIVRWNAVEALETITGESYGNDIPKWEQLINEGN